MSQPDTGEQALEIADMLIRSGALDVIVIDSVAALVPRAEIEGEMGDSHVGLQARLMSQALRKITGILNNSGTTAIFINQLREKIGVMFGSPETTTGGRALKFYSSVRLDVRRIESLKDGTDVVGNRTRVKVVKNKVAAPFKQAEFDIMYGKGISREGSLIDVGVEQSIIRKSGAWYTYDGDQLGPGQGEGAGVPQGEPRRRRRDREEDPGEARRRARPPATPPAARSCRRSTSDRGNAPHGRTTRRTVRARVGCHPAPADAPSNPDEHPPTASPAATRRNAATFPPAAGEARRAVPRRSPGRGRPFAGRWRRRAERG